MDKKCLYDKILEITFKEYKKALKENRPEVDGYAHCYAILKDLLTK